MVNRMEKVERSLKDHYVLSDKIFNEIKTLGKKLIKADVKDKNLTNNNIIISEMFGNLGSKIDVTNEITSNLEKIILGDKNQIIEDPFEDFNLEVLSSNSPKNIKNITFSQEDEINLFESNQAFILNYHFNILLVFLLGLEMLINLVYSILIKNLDNNSLKRILFLCIDNYTNLVWYYNENFKNLEALNIPKDFPKSFDLADSNICYCDIKKGNNYFILLFSELKMNYKYIESIETKEFCENKCLNNNTSKSSNNKEKVIKNRINSDFNRKYSTLTSRSNSLIRNFSSIINTEIDQNISPKDINYNKTIFSVLEKFKELTSTKSYKPSKTQLYVENYWTEIFKDKYKENTYRSIQDLHPNINRVFILSDNKILQRVYPDS